MTPEEKLAREICWVGFGGRPQGITKAAYWKRIPESSRKNYEYDAARFVYLLSRLPIETVNLAHDLARKAKP